jgi:hypothetical protein
MSRIRPTRAHLEDVFSQTGDFAWAWTRREDNPWEPSVAQPNTETWLHAILVLKLLPEGYRYTFDST